MPFREGEVYQCPEVDCGCELTVTKAAQPDYNTGEQEPPSCCGKTMVKTRG
jgi:hypothetical protein